MVATAIYSVTMVLWKETAFPLCRAMERRWKRNVVSHYYEFRQVERQSRYYAAARAQHKIIIIIIIILFAQ